MTKKGSEFSLGLEEFVMAIHHCGSPEYASYYMAGNVGKQSDDNYQGRLLAGSHSLMAKDLLQINSGAPTLAKELASVIRPVYNNDFVLRCNFSERGIEQLLNFYFQGEKIVKHEVRTGVIHRLAQVKDKKEVANIAEQFFNWGKRTDFETSSFTLLKPDLDKAKDLTVKNPEALEEHLLEVGVPEETAKIFAQDMIAQSFKGGVVKSKLVIEGEEAEEHAEGFLLLKGKSRLWIINMSMDGDMVVNEPVACNSGVFAETLLNLIK